MGFIEQSRQRLRLSRQRKQLESEPRPHALCELARGYLALGDRDVANEVVEFAARIFPDSEDVRRLRATLHGGDLDARLLRAKEEVAKRPNVASFLELADAYRALGRDEQYGSTLREALERFQADSTVLTQLAELRYRRYLESFATPDGKAALDLYQRAIGADRENLKARFQAAELLYRIGAFAACDAQIRELLEIAPEHDRAAILARHLESSVEDTRDLLSCFAQVEERMEFAGQPLPWDRTTTSSANPIDPMPELELLTERCRARQVVYFDGAGVMHARRCDSSFADSVAKLNEACARAGRGMELGASSRFTIEADSGSIVLEMKRGAAIGLLLPEQDSVDAAAVIARDSLERMTAGA